MDQVASFYMHPSNLTQQLFLEDAVFFSSVYFWCYFIGQKSGVHKCKDICLELNSIPFIKESKANTMLYRSMAQLEIVHSDTSSSSFIRQDCFSFPGIFVLLYD